MVYISCRCPDTSVNLQLPYTETENYSTMPLKFAANLSMMFTQETDSLPERYQLASSAGFSAVECAYPYSYSVDELVSAKEGAGVKQVLMNTWPGGADVGGYGVGALPGMETLFREKLEVAITYAKALQCPRMRIMAAKQPSDVDDSAMERVYLENLRYAADRLQKEGIVAMMEPCNNHSMPHYFMNHPQKALRYIHTLNHPNLRLQLDLFHLQQIEGNLTRNIKEYLPYVEHIQVAQVPDRHEPDSPGEIDYAYTFHLLEELGYTGWIGLEYKPVVDTVQGLSWMSKMGYRLDGVPAVS